MDEVTINLTNLEREDMHKMIGEGEETKLIEDNKFEVSRSL